MEATDQLYAAVALSLGKESPATTDWVGHRAWLDVWKKNFLFLEGIEPWTIQIIVQ
jgi:hypothetical protein